MFVTTWLNTAKTDCKETFDALQKANTNTYVSNLFHQFAIITVSTEGAEFSTQGLAIL